jgi:hypothetical protein
MDRDFVEDGGRSCLPDRTMVLEFEVNNSSVVF